MEGGAEDLIQHAGLREENGKNTQKCVEDVENAVQSSNFGMPGRDKRGKRG